MKEKNRYLACTNVEHCGLASPVPPSTLTPPYPSPLYSGMAFFYHSPPVPPTPPPVNPPDPPQVPRPAVEADPGRAHPHRAAAALPLPPEPPRSARHPQTRPGAAQCTQVRHGTAGCLLRRAAPLLHIERLHARRGQPCGVDPGRPQTSPPPPPPCIVTAWIQMSHNPSHPPVA